MNTMQYTRFLYRIYRHTFGPAEALKRARSEANQPTPF
jgi:hypothetical protein